MHWTNKILQNLWWWAAYILNITVKPMFDRKIGLKIQN